MAKTRRELIIQLEQQVILAVRAHTRIEVDERGVAERQQTCSTEDTKHHSGETFLDQVMRGTSNRTREETSPSCNSILKNNGGANGYGNETPRIEHDHQQSLVERYDRTEADRARNRMLEGAAPKQNPLSSSRLSPSSSFGDSSGEEVDDNTASLYAASSSQLSAVSRSTCSSLPVGPISHNGSSSVGTTTFSKSFYEAWGEVSTNVRGLRQGDEDLEIGGERAVDGPDAAVKFVEGVNTAHHLLSQRGRDDEQQRKMYYEQQQQSIAEQVLIPRLPLSSSSRSALNVSKSELCYWEKNCVECPQGKLGLILDSKRGSGVFIYAIRSHSPLRSVVQKGDLIIAIDGQDVTSMGTHEVTKLMTSNDTGRRFLTILSKVEIPPDELRLVSRGTDEEFDA
jgi:hypothetical protein